ncbi:MAG: hypothetical protein R3C29_09890 [Dehalococcoidia bacterium]
MGPRIFERKHLAGTQFPNNVETRTSPGSAVADPGSELDRSTQIAILDDWLSGVDANADTDFGTGQASLNLRGCIYCRFR